MIMVVVKILSRFTSLILKETNTPEQILKLIHAITTKNIGSLCYHNTYKYVNSIIIIVVITTIIITRPKPAYGQQGLAGRIVGPGCNFVPQIGVFQTSSSAHGYSHGGGSAHLNGV